MCSCLKKESFGRESLMKVSFPHCLDRLSGVSLGRFFQGKSVSKKQQSLRVASKPTQESTANDPECMQCGFRFTMSKAVEIGRPSRHVERQNPAPVEAKHLCKEVRIYCLGADLNQIAGAEKMPPNGKYYRRSNRICSHQLASMFSTPPKLCS